MKIFFKPLFAILITAALDCHALLIGSFPGLDKAVGQADVIAIIRIEEHIQPYPDRNLSTRHQCLVYQVLKGDLKPEQRLPLDLIDTRWQFESPFSLSSTHLVFLSKSGTNYQSVLFEGSSLRLSPFGNEKLPGGKTVHEQIKVLLGRSVEYWDKQWKSEREFMEKSAK